MDDDDDGTYRVEAVEPKSLIARWNEEHPDCQVSVGDIIVAVDGTSVVGKKAVSAMDEKAGRETRRLSPEPVNESSVTAPCPASSNAQLYADGATTKATAGAAAGCTDPALKARVGAKPVAGFIQVDKPFFDVQVERAEDAVLIAMVGEAPRDEQGRRGGNHRPRCYPPARRGVHARHCGTRQCDRSRERRVSSDQ